jgi:hypothetical protein
LGETSRIPSKIERNLEKEITVKNAVENGTSI